MAEEIRSGRVYKNLILANLPMEVAAAFSRQLQPVELPIRKAIYQANEPIRHAYFPEVGMLSVVSHMEDGASIEVGTIGSEGVSSSHRCWAQVKYRINASFNSPVMDSAWMSRRSRWK